MRSIDDELDTKIDELAGIAYEVAVKNTKLIAKAKRLTDALIIQCM
jgi:hypothetical protein